MSYDPDPTTMSRGELVDAIAQTGRELDTLGREIGDGEPTRDQASWWTGLTDRFEAYSARLRVVDDERAERMSRLVPPDPAAG